MQDSVELVREEEESGKQPDKPPRRVRWFGGAGVATSVSLASWLLTVHRIEGSRELGAARRREEDLEGRCSRDGCKGGFEVASLAFTALAK